MEMEQYLGKFQSLLLAYCLNNYKYVMIWKNVFDLYRNCFGE